MQEKTFEATYTVVAADDETFDVTFELSQDAEEALFRGLADKIHDQASEGVFDAELIHLYKRLANQQQSHPPWFEVDEDRTYDLALTMSDYSTITEIVGKQLTNVLRPSAADTYEELIDVWSGITQDILIEQELRDLEDELAEEIVEYPDPDNGEFKCFIHDGKVAVFENDDGDRWYRCNVCETTYAEIGDQHGCLHDE